MSNISQTAQRDTIAPMERTQVLLMFGGESPEHDISIASAHNVYAALDEKYDVTLCYITRTGQFWVVESIDDRTEGEVMLPVLGKGYFILPDESRLEPDVLLPVLHGPHGEDGTIQGLAQLLHIPCVGPSLLGASISMDKDITKRLVAAEGVPVANWITWHTKDQRPLYENVRAKLGETLFVKPVNAGSSIGVTKVKSDDDFTRALTVAAEFDDRVMIETALTGREIEVSILGNEHPRVSVPGEVIPGDEFYTYDDKYDIDSAAQIRVPADLDAETEERIRQYALRAYHATRGYGMARMDFFVSESNGVYLGEINSIPGFTNISMYPKLWRHEGISYPQLIEKLIELSLRG